MRHSLSVALLPFFGLVCAVRPSPAATTITVDSKANIFAAGRSSTSPMDGAVPPSYSFAAGEGKVLTFQSVAGTLRCGPSPWTPSGPDGLAYPSNIASYNNISGIIHPKKSFFLVGVFLTDNLPYVTPARLDFTDDSFLTLSPVIGQTFFIGDGLTGTGSGTPQQFVVPSFATRLFLGFAEANNFSGSPGYYSDNSGSLTATFTIAPSGGPAAACSYTLSATSGQAPSAGGPNTVSVTAAAGCGWTAVSNASWITITSGAAGSGNGTVAWSVAANTGAASRQGTLTIAGQTFTVTQAGTAPACSYMLSPASTAAPSSGATGSVSVTTAAACPWTAASNSSWITVTAGATGSGPGAVSYSVAANSGSSQRTGSLAIAGQTFTVTQAGASAVPPPLSKAPAISGGGVVNAADYTSCVAPGMIFSVFGSNLAPGTRSATSTPLPRSLDGVSVEVQDGDKTVQVPLFFVSTTQINAHLPFDIQSDSVVVTVRTPSGASAAETVPVNPLCPRLFTKSLDGKGEPILVHADYTLVSNLAPALPGETLTLFLTGLGSVDPVPATGVPAGDGSAGRTLSQVASRVTVRMGGQSANVLFAGLAPGFVGLYQLNFTVPRDIIGGVLPFSVRCLQKESQSGITMAVRAAPPLATASIGPGGGTIRAAGINLTVPVGAFSSSQSLSVYRYTAEQFPDQLSDTYRLAGSGPPPAAPVTLAVDLNRAPEPGANLTMVVEWLGEDGTRPAQFMTARLQGNTAVATIPALATYAGKTAKSVHRHASVDEYLVGIRLIEPKVQRETAHFRLEVERYRMDPSEAPPSGSGPETIPDMPTVAAIERLLEDSLKRIETSVKLPWTCGPLSQGGKMLVKIYPFSTSVFSKELPPPGQTGLKEDSPVELNARMMGIKSARMGARDELDEVVIATPHELFHSLQNCYSGDRTNWLWMDEASATWFERVAAAEIDAAFPATQAQRRLPPNVTRSENFGFALRHGLQYDLGDQIPVQNHGYGASLFLHHLNSLGGGSATGTEPFTAKLYRRARSFRASPVDAIGSLLAEITPKEGIQEHWRVFNRHWMEQRAYHPETTPQTAAFPGWQIIRGIEGPVQKLDLAPGDSVDLSWDAPDLSARLYRILLKKPPDWPAKTTLVVRGEDPGGEAIWTAYSSRSGSPAERNWRRHVNIQNNVAGENRITDIETIADGRTDFLLLVANGRAVKPYNGTTPIRLNVRAEPFVSRLKDFKYEVQAFIGVGMNVPKSCTIQPGTLEVVSRAGIRTPRELSLVWAYPTALTAQLTTSPDRFDIFVGSNNGGTGRVSFDATFAGDRVQEARVSYEHNYTSGTMKGSSTRIAFTLKDLPVAPLGTSSPTEYVFEAKPATRANLSSLDYSLVGNGGTGSCTITLNDLDWNSAQREIQLRIKKAP